MHHAAELELKHALVKLFEFMQRLRVELAAARVPSDSPDPFDSMSAQLDAIVEATEQATNTILESVEAIEAAVQVIAEKTKDPEIAAKTDEVAAQIGRIFEACSFQDITGQRVTKVVTSLKFLDERLTRMVEIWGRTSLSQVAPASPKAEGDRALLQGPQLKGQGVSQAQIDSLFSDDEVDRVFAGKR